MELVRALAVLVEPPSPAHAGIAAALDLPEPPEPSGWADLFLFQLHPYASVHLGPEGMLGGEARGRIAGFWRAVGRTPLPEPDHLAALLGLWAALLDEAARLERGGTDRPPEGEAQGAPVGPAPAALVDRAADALLHEHLLPWLPPFLDRVQALGGPHQGAWAALLMETLVSAADASGMAPPLSRHLVEAPGLPDPRGSEGPGGFVPGLLAPARSGLVLTRHDLAEVGRTVGLGLRAGERRYALEHLLGLEPAGVLEALADLAAARGREHAGWPETLGAVRAFWTARAGATQHLLRELASDARASAEQGGETPTPPAAAGSGAPLRPGSEGVGP